MSEHVKHISDDTFEQDVLQAPGPVLVDVPRDVQTDLYHGPLEVEMDLPGYAIGGLAVGEPREVTREMIARTLEWLPKDKPRYVMGVGYPDEIEEYARMGVDMMDCVLPTRAGRHGLLFMREEGGGPVVRMNIKRKEYAEDGRPIDESCGCMVCRRYSRAYLRHLFVSGEALGLTLNSVHNLAFYLDTMQRVRGDLAGKT